METTILYGTKKGDFIEYLITESEDENHIKNAKYWASQNGFSIFREVKYNEGFFEKPNFTKVIN